MKKAYYFLLMSLVAFPLTILSCTSSAKKGESSETPADSTSKEGTANEEKVSFTVKGVTFNMILVKGGTFDMGATDEQGTDAKADEKPVHSVTLSDYYIAETEVTQALYEAVIGSNPADSVGAELPVVLIEWGDADLFASKLSEITGRKFRLPTEAEWEYAARGGNKSKGFKYAGSNNISDVAWFNNIEGGSHTVKGKAPNELGIYDMSGNVDEYCADDYAPYSKDSQTDPKCELKDGGDVTVRGGSFVSEASDCRVSRRGSSRGYVFGSLGFRIAMSVDK
ncbi:MAG: SUMF1/EgtB/PvdO family nonheme iron enzyme [Prevotella sp.]|nr:SUMF1/EgtB/PvdO family nonheme iron enzyme [Prevotella sp.]